MKMNSEKKLKILDMILVSLTAVILLVVAGLVILQPTNNKLVLVVVGLLALVLIVHYQRIAIGSHTLNKQALKHPYLYQKRLVWAGPLIRSAWR